MTIFAKWTINQYTVTVFSGGNGTVNPSGAQTVDHGIDLLISASASTNYHFVNWTVTGGLSVDNVNSASTQISNVTSDGSVTANFGIDQHTVTFAVGSNGSITGILVQTVDHGGSCTEVTAVADANYHFTAWSGDNTSSTNPLTVTNVTSDMTITANFAIDQHTVTFTAGTNGSITGTLSQAVDHGGNCTQVTAVADLNYQFDAWTGDNTSTTNPLTIANVTSDMSITANFKLKTYTVTFTVNGSGGSISGSTSQNVNHGSNCSAVTANPSTDYIFTGWTGDNTSSTNPLTITNVTSDMDIYANFVVAFVKTFDNSQGFSILQTSDDGYIICGSKNNDCLVLKVDKTGVEDWSETYTGIKKGESIKKISDGYIISGTTNAKYGYIHLLKINNSGVQQWDKQLNEALLSYNPSAPCVQLTSDGYILVANGWGIGGEGLIKTDNSGIILWDTLYEDIRHLNSVVISDGGDYIATGGWHDGTSDQISILEFDPANGDLNWHKDYGAYNTEDYGNSIGKASDGGYIITGYSDGNVPVLKTESNGDEDWSTMFGGISSDFGICAKQVSDGGFIITGFKGKDIFLIKTNASGVKQWEETFSSVGDYRDKGYEVQETSDDGFVIVGTWEDETKLILIKTDKNGKVE